MKVIRIDSYDDEGPRGTERLVVGPGLSQTEADELTKKLNESPDRIDYDYFRTVPDDYELWVFKP